MSALRSFARFTLCPTSLRGKSFDCKSKCYVGIYIDDHSPSLGDAATANDNELFTGVGSGYIRNGLATHAAN